MTEPGKTWTVWDDSTTPIETNCSYERMKELVDSEEGQQEAWYGECDQDNKIYEGSRNE